MKNITEILNQYAAGELDLKKANEELQAMGAEFHLEPGKGPGWTEEEMAQGFFGPEEMGLERKPVYLRKPDMSRRTDLAGKTVKQRTAAGEFAVTYDDGGYAVEAFRVGGVQA